MLKAIIIGHLGQDAELRQFGNAFYLSFSVAHSDKYRDVKGEEHEYTQWVSCMKRVFDGSQLGNYLTKGTKVYCEGNLSARVFSNKSGVAQVALNLNVQQLELLSVKEQQAQRPQPVASEPVRKAVEVPEMPEDDLPF